MSRAPKRPNHSLGAALAVGLFLAAYVTVSAVVLFSMPASPEGPSRPLPLQPERTLP